MINEDLASALRAVIYKPKYCSQCELEGHPQQEMKRVFALSRDDIIAIQSRPPVAEMARILEGCELHGISHCDKHSGHGLYCGCGSKERISETNDRLARDNISRRSRPLTEAFVNMESTVDLALARKIAMANLPKE
jgi:hypothetical protein